MKSIFRHLLRFMYRLYKKKNKKIEKTIPRRYIPSELGVPGFFSELQKRSIKYSVLRWFEILPIVEPGEDIDILVADEDLQKLDELLTGTVIDGVPCDIYTCSGLPGTDHRGVPYFPTPKAKELLDHTVLKDGLIRVPAPRYHFLSMAYHVVYHKGYASDLYSETAGRKSEGDSDHDYAAVLSGIAAEAGIPVPDMTLEALNEYLHSQGWRPQNDTLKKLSRKNRWIGDWLSSRSSQLEPYMAGLTVFIVRDEGLPFLENIRSMLSAAGFDIIDEKAITGIRREAAVREIRGGTWAKGPWPLSGGLPAHAILVFDYLPENPEPALADKHPGITNAKIHSTKIRIRDQVNALRKKGTECNTVHSADSADEALEYLAVICPENIDELKKIIRMRFEGFKTPYPVIADISKHANRAKVEIVDFKGVQAICKTFKPGCERFLEREIEARRIGGGLAEMSEILETGSNYIIIRKYENSLDDICRLKPLFQKEKLLPIWVIRKMVGAIRRFREQGFEMVDFSPTNILNDGIRSIKLIDFEFVQKGPTAVDSLKGNYAWYPIPKNFQGDLPVNLRKEGVFPYKKRWQKRTGLPVFICRYAESIPSVVLFAVQLCYVPFISVWRLPEETSRLLRNVRKTAKARLRRLVVGKT